MPRTLPASLHVCPQCRALFRTGPGYCSRDGAQLYPTDRDPLVGSVIDDYRVTSLLGDGAMGRVYRVVHIGHGRVYAMKTQWGDVAASPAMRARFAVETRIARNLHHENLIGAVDEVNPGGHPFLILELAPAGSLERWILDNGPMSSETALGILRGVLTGLAVLHARGIIHRDVKPANILLHRQTDGTWVPRLSDLGVARVSGGGGHTIAGSVVGSPSYMPPEQARGEPVDARSDLYAVGATLEAMLTAELPFRGTPDQILAMKASSRGRLGASPKLEPRLRTFIRKLSATRMEDRPSSAVEALSLLEIIERTCLTRRRQAMDAAEPEPPRWRRAAVAAAAMCVVAMAGVTPYFVAAENGRPAPVPLVEVERFTPPEGQAVPHQDLRACAQSPRR